jgi:hypothetical protein
MTDAAEADFIEATGHLGLSAHRRELPSGQASQRRGHAQVDQTIAGRT